MLERDDKRLLEIARNEIERVHRFIATWFRGAVAGSSDEFERQLGASMADDLINIQPSGRALTKHQLLDGIRGAHGANPAFDITISDCAVQGVFDEGRLILATYRESQTGAKNTIPADNDRVTTVLFELRPDSDRPLWLHLHETAVDR